MSVVISILALGIGLWVLAMQKKSTATAEKALHLAKASKEKALRNSMYNARNRVHDFGLQLNNLNEENIEEEIHTYQHIYHTILENYFEVFDRACKSYEANRIDRAKFKKEFEPELKSLIENTCYARFFVEDKVSYKAMLRLYKQWTKVS